MTKLENHTPASNKASQSSLDLGCGCLCQAVVRSDGLEKEILKSCKRSCRTFAVSGAAAVKAARTDHDVHHSSQVRMHIVTDCTSVCCLI